ncbi:MAG: tetratricopeptide repeat protein [Muribaculaceae bacterium]|nr:tetratricopeptide repeat protein [Muribaculaceae bacterium]
MNLKNRNILKIFITLLIGLSGWPVIPLYSQPQGKDVHTSRYYVSRAEELENSNAWEAAKKEIDEGLKLYPEDPDLLYLNGKYYYQARRDLQKARYNLVKALQISDHHWGARRLLIDVEDESNHYSSAICYINELLEQQPYDRDLWRRKIALYRKTGNKVEADAALERLARIYPNDSIVIRERNAIQRDNWTRRLSTSSMAEQIAKLEELVNNNPDVLDYYMELSDLYIKMGDYDKALNVAKRGLVVFPANNTLVQRVASLMSEQGLYTRVLSFLKENRVGGAYYANAMREAVNDARLRDPYDISGRLYDTTGDRDALSYLLNTSITRGYYDDALMYLKEAYKIEGRTNDLLLKEYELHKRMGNEGAASRLLQELFSNNPDDPDLKEEYIAMQLQLANIDGEQEDWEGAYKRLTDASKYMPVGSDQWVAAVSRRINILGKLGKWEEARRLYGEASTDDPVNRSRFAAAYEDFMALKIKDLIENDRYEEALHTAQDLLSTIPDSETAVRASINMSQTLKKNDLFYKYAAKGYELFPDQPYFIIRQAVALQQQGRYPQALSLLDPKKDGSTYANPQLIAPFAGMSQDFAQYLLEQKMPEEALSRIDAALEFDPDNRDLLYMKGVAYEQMRDFKNAYQYQVKNYNPSNAEQEEWMEHMRYLSTRSLPNRFMLSYTGAYYDTRQEELASVGHLYSVASLGYAHLWKNTSISAGINYKATDGYNDGTLYESGGSGLEGWAEVNQTLPHGWNMMISGSYGNKYFNKVGGNLAFMASLKKGWSLGAKASYRLTPPVVLYEKNTGWQKTYKRRNLGLLGPRVSKEWNKIGLHLNLDLIALDVKEFYYNVSLQGKFFIKDDAVSAISALAGVGSFPELTFFDELTMNGISNMNAMVGVDGTFLVTKNLILGISGAWNTFYDPKFTEEGKAVDSYRNIYSITGNIQICF